MKPVAVVDNSPLAPPGRLLEVLEERGVPVLRCQPFAGDPLPDPEQVAGLVVLGGEMGAYDTHDYPYLEAEKRLIAAAAERELPVLGICLGAQLAADALGGRAYRSPRAEAGVVTLDYTPAGERHPVLSRAGRRVFAVHQDTFDLPPGATLLAYSAHYPHAFSQGSVLAVQFHPETPTEVALEWGERDLEGLLAEAGLSLDDYRAQVREAARELEASARRLFQSWVDAILSPAAQPLGGERVRD